MTNLTTFAIIGASVLILFPAVTNAADFDTMSPSNSGVETYTQMQENEITRSSDLEGLLEVMPAKFVSQSREITPAKFMSKPTQDSFSVSDETGMVFYNHTVEQSELPKFDYDLNQVDEYSFTHEGRTYTNKVVSD